MSGTFGALRIETLECLFDTLIIKRDAAPDETPGGVLLPDDAKEKPKTGTVVRCGPGLIHEKTGERIPMGVSVGDRICFKPFIGQTFQDADGKSFEISKIEQVLARIE
jgi:chaperonin GroES